LKCQRLSHCPANNSTNRQENAMIDTPQIVQSEQQRTAAIHVTPTRSEIQQVFGPAVGELMAALTQQGVAPTGPLLSYHLKMPSDAFDFEIALPVEGEVKPVGRVMPSELPATKVVRTIYSGPMEGLGSAWGELQSWIGEKGLMIKPMIWERYLVGPDSTNDPAAWRTELNWPLAD
jgi:effector-binding domain-containing protein